MLWSASEPISFQLQLEQALEQSFVQGPETLLSFVERFEEDHYWHSFGLFYLGIHYQYREDQDEAFAKMYCDKAIELLSSRPSLDSEDLALLSYISGFTLQWYKGPSQWLKAQRTKSWAKQATELDPNNPRACFVYGNLDSYTPKSLGGGKVAYSMLLEAKEKLEAEVSSSSEPSWGLLKTYQALTRYCLETGRNEEAKSLLQQGLNLFPEDIELQQRRLVIAAGAEKISD